MAKQPVQKGPIKMEDTSKHQLYKEKQREAQKETDQRRDGQDLKYHQTGSEPYRS